MKNGLHDCLGEKAIFTVVLSGTRRDKRSFSLWFYLEKEKTKRLFSPWFYLEQEETKVSLRPGVT